MSQGIGNTTLAFLRTWHHVSARDRVLGPLAVSIATVLMGKHKPRGIYDPAVDAGDYVVVTDARSVRVTGKKEQQIVYRHHTMYPGGLKEITYKEMMKKKPEEIIRKAVSGMLPKNRLRDRRLERLKIFAGPDHPYAANITKRYDLQTPFADPPSSSTPPRPSGGASAPTGPAASASPRAAR